jgi:hypothetical protein
MMKLKIAVFVFLHLAGLQSNCPCRFYRYLELIGLPRASLAAAKLSSLI